MTAHSVCRPSGWISRWMPDCRQSHATDTLVVRQSLVRNREGGIGFSCPLSPLCSLSPPSPRLSALRNPTPLYLYPTHLTTSPQPALWENLHLLQTLGPLLVPGFGDSVLSSLGWDTLRAHRRNGCAGIQRWLTRSGRRSRIPLLSTSPHTS